MSSLRRQEGFSLVEVLAALLIMGLAVVALTLSFDSAIGLRERASDQTKLPLLAEEKMESIMAGEERAEEGDLAEPWRDIHWRLYTSMPSDGLTLYTLRLTRRDHRDQTLYKLSAARLAKERE